MNQNQWARLEGENINIMIASSSSSFFFFNKKEDLKCNPNHVFTHYYINKNIFDDGNNSILYKEKKK